MDRSRREFLKKVAAGTAYAAPVIHSVAAPERLSAQGTSPKGGGMGGGKGPSGTSTTDIQFGPSAPWNN